MIKKIALFCLVALIGAAQPSFAITIEQGGVTFGVNMYLDLQYMYMSKMPMAMDNNNMGGGGMGGMGPMFMTMHRQSTFEQKNLNLLFDAEKDNYRAHLNFQSKNAYSSSDNQGEWEVAEAYGEIRFSDLLSVKAGHFLAPFGLFNEYRYVTPLYASVVLPMVYEMHMYDGHRMTPDDANLSAGGNYGGDDWNLNYSLYTGNGLRNEDGANENTDMALGARVRFSFLDNYNLGASYYTAENDAENDAAKEGRMHMTGLDLEVNLLEDLLLQAEFVRDFHSRRSEATTYYIRTTYTIGDWAPFVMYDFFEDPDDPLQKKKQNRIGAGLSYDLSTNVRLKTEYHMHWFKDDEDLPDGTDRVHMFRSAVIFVF